MLWFCVTVMLQLRYAVPLHLYVLTPTLRSAQPGSWPAHERELQLRVVQGKDLLQDVQQMMHSFYHLMQPNNISKKKKKPPFSFPFPFHYKPLLDRLAFGNLTLNLAFTFNFMNTNTFGFGN